MTQLGNGEADSTSDEILMAAYQAGNEAAFRQLFDRHAGSVYGFLVRRLGDRALAEDLYQEAFLRIHRARQAYDPARPFRAWLFGIVHNLMNDSLRSRLRAPDTESFDEGAASHARAMQGDGAARDLEQGGPGAAPSSEALVANQQRGMALSRALSALPSDEATVLILARLEGLSYEDIGEVIGRSPAAAKQLAYRALKRVKAEIVAVHGREGL